MARKVVQFDHDDLDGAGCRVILSLLHRHLNPSDILIIHSSNNSIDDDVKNVIERGEIDDQTTVYFTDICPSQHIASMVDEKYHTYFFDHHKTNLYIMDIVSITHAYIIPELNGKQESGTSILYNHFKRQAQTDPSHLFMQDNPLLEEFVDTIRSWDTFEWKRITPNNLQAKRLQTLFYCLGMERFCERFIHRILYDGGRLPLILNEELPFIEAKMEMEEEAINKIIDSVKVRDKCDIIPFIIHGYKTAVMYSKGGINISDLAHQFLTKYPDFDVFIGINMGFNSFTYRCISKDIDLGSEFAKPMNGGGHPQASGSPIGPASLKMMEMLIKEIDKDSSIIL